jgi:hypothetical protein
LPIEEAGKNVVRSAFEQLALKAAEGLVAAMFPGAWPAIHIVEAVFKVVRIADHLTHGDGVAIHESVEFAYDFHIDLSVTLFAERPVAPVAVEPEWLPLSADGPPVEVSVEPGKPEQPSDAPPIDSGFEPELPAEQPQAPLPHTRPVQWFELGGVTEPATNVRVCLVDADVQTDAADPAEEVAVAAMTAPTRDVLDHSSYMQASDVLHRAAKLGAIYRDEDARAWYLKPGKAGPLAGQRRRLRAIAYMDPIHGFIAIVEVGEDGQVAFRYIVFEPGKEPAGVEVETLVIRLREPDEGRSRVARLVLQPGFVT